jgi:hypothetical protein
MLDIFALMKFDMRFSATFCCCDSKVLEACEFCAARAVCISTSRRDYCGSAGDCDCELCEFDWIVCCALARICAKLASSAERVGKPEKKSSL